MFDMKAFFLLTSVRKPNYCVCGLILLNKTLKNSWDRRKFQSKCCVDRNMLIKIQLLCTVIENNLKCK